MLYHSIFLNSSWALSLQPGFICFQWCHSLSWQRGFGDKWAGMCPQANSLSSLVCRCATRARDRDKSCPALTVCLWALWTSSLWRSAGGGSWKAEHEAKLGSQQHCWLLAAAHRHPPQSWAPGKTALWKLKRHLFLQALEHCFMGRKIMQSQGRNLFTAKEAQSFSFSSSLGRPQTVGWATAWITPGWFNTETTAIPLLIIIKDYSNPSIFLAANSQWQMLG